ncbi:MAG: MBL fold metallo-hydrolase [Candidatus Dormibacterales bacterium]
MAEVTRAVAPNPGPYTGPGTNTWIVGGGPVAVVIDPGPDVDTHLAAIERRLRGVPVGAVLLTHAHLDHAPLAARLAGVHGCRVLAHADLEDGDVVRAGALSLTALRTPGHSSDHLCFWMEDDRAAFTGDLVLGGGSTMVAHPDGDMAAYLASLERLTALGPRILFPGHWDPVLEAGPKLDEYRRHRLAREAQVLAELARAPGTARALTERIYAGEVGPELMGAAEMTLRAHLAKLAAEGRVEVSGKTYRLRG